MIFPVGLLIPAPRGLCHCQNPSTRNDYDEETTHNSHINPEPSLQSGPGGSIDTNEMAPFLFASKSLLPWDQIFFLMTALLIRKFKQGVISII